MRFYDISISSPTGNAVTRADGSSYRWTSYANGRSLPGAQQVELDVPTAGFATPIGGAQVRIWGVALQDISQAADLNDNTISVQAGMKPGLPLANTQKSGLILTGRVQQAFGNWIGTDQYLEFVIIPSIGSLADPKNLSFNWTPGQSLSDAITAMIGPAFPGFTTQFQISSALQTQERVQGVYGSITQFAAWLKSMTQTVGQKVLGQDYIGVEVTLNQTQFTFWDGTVKPTAIQLAFTDMIGQPTWIGPNQIQVNTVMRPDLSLGCLVTLPRTIITTTNPGVTAYRYKSAFQGNLQLQMIRHIGNFRAPSADAWITTFNGFAVSQ